MVKVCVAEGFSYPTNNRISSPCQRAKPQTATIPKHDLISNGILTIFSPPTRRIGEWGKMTEQSSDGLDMMEIVRVTENNLGKAAGEKKQ